MRYKLKDLCKRISSGGTPSRKIKEYYEQGGINWIKTQELKDCNIYGSEEKITELGLKNSSAKIFPKDTVTMAMYGATVGKLGILKTESATNQACCNMVADPDKLDYKFLFYSLLYNRDEIVSLANGAAQQNLNKKTIEEFEINYFPIQDQKKIASILSSLDEKIELNHRINQNLEEMAQAIFKSWFIDFEPFQEGEFVESELGPIPKGWEVCTLKDIAELTMGLSPKSETYNEEGLGLPLLNGAADFNGTLIQPKKFTTDPKRICSRGEIVFCIRATIGNVTFADGKYCLGRGVASLKPKEGFDVYVYYTLKNSLDQLVAQASGSVFLNLTKSEINSLKVLIPPKNISDKFHQLIYPLIQQKLALDSQNTVLSSLRDTLLPKLMSGEIRMPLEKEEALL